MAGEQKLYFVYIMTNRSKTLYTGVTNGLVKRVHQHKTHVNEGFTTEYKIDRLAYYERLQVFVKPSPGKNKLKGGRVPERLN
jgi:putative endonuclease